MQWRNATLTAWSRTQQTVSLSSAEAEFFCPDDWCCRKNGDETSFAILMNHIDNQSAKAWASKRGLGRMKHVTLKNTYVQDVVEKKLTNLA